MSGVRKNTLVIDFSVVPVRPEVRKVEHFLEHEIKLNLSDVKSIQLHNTRNCVYIEMVDNSTALRYEKAHNIKRVVVWKDKQFKIPVYVDSEAVTVRVHDLPPSVPHATVGDFMMKYGEVFSIQSERWKHYFAGIPNGVRVLQMRIKHPIPSYLTIANEVCYVEHPNQIRTCRRCSKPAHPKQRCMEVSLSGHETVTAAPVIASVTEPIFNQTDFPPISSEQSTPSSPDASDPFAKILAKGKLALTELDNKAPEEQQSSSEGDDDDDDGNGSSSSPCENNDGTNKRRLSTKRGKEKKKLCAIQGSQSSCDSNLSKNDKCYQK